MHSKLKECFATRVILVRHGQSTYNSLGLYQGCSDNSVLTEVGYSDAHKTGNFLKGLEFDAIYTSSLQRAQQTAKEILNVVAPSFNRENICVSELLRETDLPAWEGLAFQYVKENFATEYSNWKQRPHEFRMGHMYPAIDLYDRVKQFWRQVLPHHVGKTLLLVVHGGTNRALISTALGITPDRYHCIQQSNCGISVLNFPDGTLESGRLELMNFASHVGEHLPKPQEGGKGLRLLLVASGACGEQIDCVIQQLKGVNIGFGLIDTYGDSQTLAIEVIKQHPEIVYLNVLKSSELQREISRKITDSNHLVNVLVVAEAEIIKSLIAEAIGMDINEKTRLQVKPGTISSIQYVGKHHPPILQVLNTTTITNVGLRKHFLTQYKMIF